MEELVKPYGWTAPDPTEVAYDFGEARYGSGPDDIPANDTGTDGKSQEDEYHSRWVSPDSAAVAKTPDSSREGYGNTDKYRPQGGEADPGDVGTLDLPMGHMVIENGIASGHNYYLVRDIDTKKFYTVVPNFKEGQTYTSPMRVDRTSALADAYRVLASSLPDSALAQLRQRFPETPALEDV